MIARTRLLVSLSALTLAAAARAEGPALVPQATDPVSVKADLVIDKALAYLKTKQQPDGTWQQRGESPALTALVLKSFMSDGKFDADDAWLEKGFEALLKFQKPDGGIYDENGQGNYNTAIAVTALAASKETEYRPQMFKAVAYLKNLQWNDTVEGAVTDRQAVPPTDPRYGGWGYGGPQNARRPDGSNMQIALDALHDSELKADDPAYKAAIAFASRLQNRSESNDQKWAGNDGGFVYTDAQDGQSAAGEEVINGVRVVRSYGSMTYAGLKSMIYAGLSKDDPRVKAAWAWIGKNYTWDENPGIKMGPNKTSLSGLYYYYHTASRALRAYDEPMITDAQGVKHDWRKDLVDKIATLQKPDGSFIGESKWMENNPTIATTFAVLSLEEAKADLRAHPPK
jgi:squalene-hopene/tetraprenyl-beta-curcumene cyclase